MTQKYDTGSVRFVAVFPGIYYSKAAIDSFMTVYDLRIPALMDTSNVIASFFQVTVTPEAVLCNAAGEVLYRGAIDDWAYAEGRKRPAPVHHFLDDAIASVISGENPSPSETKPIGCFIE
jgi:hypothetical protein